MIFINIPLGRPHLRTQARLGPECVRSFTDEVVIFMHSHHVVSASSTLLVGTVQTEVQIPRSRRKGKEAAIGHTAIFNVCVAHLGKELLPEAFTQPDFDRQR